MAWRAPSPRRPRPTRNAVKFIGNVPAKPPSGGTLRHKGWRAAKVDLPALAAQAGRLHHRARRKSKSSKPHWNPDTSLASISAPPTPRWPTRKSSADADPFAPAGVQLLEIPQLANPGEVRDEDLLPSFLYLPGASDFPAGASALPWDADRGFVVGRLAQKRGAENAGRLVSSAKSWLSHSGVDRTAPLLPFRAPEGVEKISPVEASRRYLEHLRDAWDSKMPEAPFAAQQALVTVPASFDAVARELTLEAAKQAGYENITLLEEPQAAFYAWIERHPDWRERVHVGDLILVVDIGGGTTDFTLIAVTESAGELALDPRGGGRAHPAGRRQHRPGAGGRGCRSAWPKRARASTAASCRPSGTTAAWPKRSCSSRIPRPRNSP